MHDEEKPNSLPGKPVHEETPAQASSLVMKRREMTAGFDERQMRLFNEALIATLTTDMPAEKLAEVLGKAYDTTLYVYTGQMLADSHLDKPACAPAPADRDNPERSARPMLLSCTACHGYRLTQKGNVVRCDDCGNIQPTLENVSRRRDCHEPNHSNKTHACPFCGSKAVFDDWLDLNICPDCGARETTVGWSPRIFRAEKDQAQPAAGHIAQKQIVNVSLSDSILALVFHDGTVQHQRIPVAAVYAIAYLLRVLDTMCWSREVLENRLRKLSERRNENEGQ